MKIKETVYITELEAEVLSVFVRRKILETDKIVGTLEQVIEKIKWGDENA